MRQRSFAIAWLVLASLFFYGYWNPTYLALIVISMSANFWFGKWVSERHKLHWVSCRVVLVFAVICNLASLAYFKYANFFIDNVSALLDDPISFEKVALPLAISFFTFQQIAYVVDAFRGESKDYSFFHYALFVTFFPQLIAGPIVHHKELLPQFDSQDIFRPSTKWLALGVTLFAIGLFKKVELADSLAEYSNRVFDASESGQTIWLLEAWGGALAYTFQLYFDFSGYMDMAMGSAMMIGIKLPPNFDSPYKSLNIIEFWRRWHMTLSRFLRDYLYITLGGNRFGIINRYRNLALTMLLGGLWHGAAWSFVLWGALHGGYLVINHAWHQVRSSVRLSDRSFGKPGVVCAWLLTFVAVVVGWVFFRAETIDGASNLLASMAGLGWKELPESMSGRMSGFEQVLLANGFSFQGRFVISLREWVNGGALIATSFLIVLALPNTNEIFGKSDEVEFRWRPNKRWAFFVCLLFASSILDLGKVSEFLYFNF